MATSGGHAGRSNEDFVGAAPGVLVMVDGAGIAGTEELCRHGVAWYSHTLGAALLARTTRGGTGPVEALAESIEQVAGLHRHTCDLADPSSPQATVAMVSLTGDHLDYLVLADAYVVLARAEGAPQVLTDPREVDVRDACTGPLAGLAPGSAAYARALPSVIDALRARRNQPGGYWVAKDDPRAAAEAVTGSVPLDELTGAAVLSNGASRFVDPYRLGDWPAALELLRTDGAQALIQRVRHAEVDGSTEPDDASAAYWELPEASSDASTSSL